MAGRFEACGQPDARGKHRKRPDARLFNMAAWTDFTVAK